MSLASINAVIFFSKNISPNIGDENGIKVLSSILFLP